MKQSILDIDPSEQVEFEIKRHPIGLVWIYITGSFITVLFVAIALGAGFFDTVTDLVPLAAVYLVFGGLAVLAVLTTVIAAKVYSSNELIITSENLIQIIQTSLFNRRVSQLSLEKVQDVTSTQRGVAQSLFNYGTIFIETAGEAANFGFRYTGDPNITAKQINEAHERFIKKFGIDVV